jgi:hypothetical protein
MKNDKTYKKLEENWKKMEEGMMPPMFAFNAGAQLAAANAGRQIADIENERFLSREKVINMVINAIKSGKTALESTSDPNVFIYRGDGDTTEYTIKDDGVDKLYSSETGMLDSDHITFTKFIKLEIYER